MPAANLVSLPLWLNLALYLAAALIVWIAGTRLSAAADAFAEHTGIGRAFVGALLLGGITSLPELTTTLTAVSIDNPQLAINNLLGGVAMQIMVLAMADATLRGQSLSRKVDDAAVLLQAVLLVVVLNLTAAGLLYARSTIFGLNYWTVAITITSALSLYLVHNLGDRQPWIPRQTASDGSKEKPNEHHPRHWVVTLIVCSFAIVVAGIILTQSADALAIQTGLHAGFIGAVTLALATSLPEISTTIGAVRLGQYTMAYSNIFGANLLDLSLLLVADIAYFGGPILSEGGDFALGICILASLLTAITLIGLVERRRVVVLRVGLDSLVLAAAYVGGLAVIYFYSK